MDREFFAACTLGLEEVLRDELVALGAADVRVVRGGAVFFGDLRLGYAANLWLRSATRVQELLIADEIRTQDDLYEVCASVAWRRLMDVDQTLAVEASVKSSCITHSGYAAVRVKDVIADHFRAVVGRRPSVDVKDPDLPLQLVLRNDELALYRNLSGPSLHKRGYRPVQVKSPLNEATAAGLLLLSGVDLRQGFVDPMCGSATFLIEAAWIASGRAPGRRRRFAFERWLDFDETLWRELLDDADAREASPFGLELIGADRHAGAVQLARRALKAARVESVVRVEHASLSRFDPDPPSLVVTNPPWGKRLDDETEETWQRLGRFLHQRCRGATALVLCGHQKLTRHLGLRASARYPVRVGSIDCRLLRYDIFADGPPVESTDVDVSEP